MNDPIVAEVRRIREEYAKKLNYDLDAIFADLKEREVKSEDTFVSFPAKRIPVSSSKSATHPHDAT